MNEVKAANLGKILYSMNISQNEVMDTLSLLDEEKELVFVLTNPMIAEEEKNRVIDRLFPEKMRDFVRVLLLEESLEIAGSIKKEYNELILKGSDRILATLECAKEPNENELQSMRDMICKKYNKAGVLMEVSVNEALLGGYILTVGDVVYDNSISGNLNRLARTLARR